MRSLYVVACATLVSVFGCDSSGQGSGSTASAAPGTSAASAAGATAPAAAPAGNTKLTADQISNANFEIFGPSRMKDPFDAKLKDLKAKLGEPSKTDGDLLYWWGAGKAVSTGPYCQELRVDTKKQGLWLEQTDKSKCGM